MHDLRCKPRGFACVQLYKHTSHHFQMAFILTPNFITLLHDRAAVKRPSSPTTPCCTLRTAIGKTLAAPAAALLLTITPLSLYQALADEAPLVFDHDQSLEGADFSNRNDLRGAIFSKSNCKKATFAGSDLTNSQLDDANVSNPLFMSAFCNEYLETSVPLPLACSTCMFLRCTDTCEECGPIPSLHKSFKGLILKEQQ